MLSNQKAHCPGLKWGHPVRLVIDGEKQEAGGWTQREGTEWRLGMCSQ